jgi:hypothetical protein
LGNLAISAPAILSRHANIVRALQIEPELRAHTEPVAEPQRGVAGDGALALHDLVDAVRRHPQLAGKLGRRDRYLRQLLGEDFSGVDGGSRVHRSLNDNLLTLTTPNL